MSEDFGELIASFCDQWNQAEKAIKLAEQVNSKIINPAIYELRYAGRRLVEAFENLEKDNAKAIKLIGDAEFDCCRARHDALDAATSKIAADLSIAVRKLGAKNVLQYFPTYTDLISDLGEITDRISVSRENRDDRDEIYATIQTGDLPALVRKFNGFRKSEPLLKAAARRERAIFWSAIAFGVIGVIGTIYTAASFYASDRDFKPPEQEMPGQTKN